MPSVPSLYETESVWIVGIDLAWGPRSKDGICLLKANHSQAEVLGTDLVFGDDALRLWIRRHIPANEPALLAIDAPLIVPNASGSRPVDRQISADFWKHHAGAHPANQSICARPLKVAAMLRDDGFEIGYDLRKASRLAAEVYPHPATIRMFEIEQIVKYKKGADKVREFKRLQGLLLKYLSLNTRLKISESIHQLLGRAANKSNQAQVDALICALIGFGHWRTRGHLCEIVGTLDEGFILLPPVTRNGFPLFPKSSREENHSAITPDFVKGLLDEDP